jgi:hypothetical protein
MIGIKGIVLLTRFDYVDRFFGREALKSMTVSLEKNWPSQLMQPVGISKDYPEALLKAVDEQLLNEYFDNQVSRFFDLGVASAAAVVSRYFQLYADDKNPQGFLQQMARTRRFLIGLGELEVGQLNNTSVFIHLNYGQPYLESVLLSEIGFLAGGVQICGAGPVSYTIQGKGEFSIEFILEWAG